MQEVRSEVSGGDSRKAAHGLEKFKCRRTERNWRAAVGGQVPAEDCFPGGCSAVGVQGLGECMCEGQEGRKVFGGGRGAEAESESNYVGMCIF